MSDPKDSENSVFQEDENVNLNKEVKEDEGEKETGCVKVEDDNSNYCLSIFVPNYNNQRYLRQTLYSILTQKTKYKYHIFVRDDKSTDHSVQIIEQIINEDDNKNKITLIKHEENQGLSGTLLMFFESIHTPYFTILDSDDYWTNDNFIEQSLDFLQSFPDFTVYSQKAALTDEVSNSIVTYSHLHTSSTFLRGSIDERVLSVMREAVQNKNVSLQWRLKENLYEGDTFRNLYFGLKGKTHLDDNNIASCYRINMTTPTRWGSLNSLFKDILHVYLYLEMFQTLSNDKAFREKMFENATHYYAFLLCRDYDDIMKEPEYKYSNKTFTSDEVCEVIDFIKRLYVKVRSIRKQD
jgi:glycosyltransferase involved in cell wall biosynthesis